jgi:hypothetical protein
MERKKTRTLDALLEAVTFAEAGETETASRIAREIFPDHSALGEQILAVAGPSGFPARMVEDAFAVAERLRYGLVALTVSPSLASVVARLGRRRAHGGRLSPEAFRARAAERGVPFVHAARRGDPEKAVADMSRRFRRIAFLLVEPALTARARFPDVDVPIVTPADV